ncbi:MAG: EamA family transporter [Spirochaetia bacterium]
MSVQESACRYRPLVSEHHLETLLLFRNTRGKGQTIVWLVFAVGSAIFVGLKNVWTRSFATSIEPRTMVFSTFFLTAVLGTAYVAVSGIPVIEQRFFWAIIAASLIDVVAITLLTRAIFMSDLSDAYPLVALTPVFTLLTSFILLGETPSLLGLSGVLVIVVGAYLLRVEAVQESIFKPFKLLFKDAGARYMMLTALMFSLMGPLFKTGMQASSPAFALTVSQWLTTLWLALIYLARGTLGNTIRELRVHFGQLAGLSVTNFMQAILTFFAFQFAFVAYVSSVKRLGILFTVLFGYIAFKERGALRGALAGTVMLVGLIMVSLGN